nr:MAG TPA: hypothetical protein [Caudoviricetes sp.]
MICRYSSELSDKKVECITNMISKQHRDIPFLKKLPK